MGFFDSIFGSSSNSEIDNALNDWVRNYESDGYSVSQKARNMMRESLDCQLHPENYSSDFLTESIMKIEAQVKEDNGQTSPLSGINSVDDFVNKAVGEIRDGMTAEQIKKAQHDNRADYYKESINSDEVARPEQLYEIEREQDAIMNEIFDVVGGSKNSKLITDWCNDNLKADEVEAINKPFRDFIASFGYMNIKVGDKLKDHLDYDLLQKCKDALYYAEARYKLMNK